MNQSWLLNVLGLGDEMRSCGEGGEGKGRGGKKFWTWETLPRMPNSLPLRPPKWEWWEEPGTSSENKKKSTFANLNMLMVTLFLLSVKIIYCYK